MEQLSIVKIGGKVIDDLQALSEFLTGFALIPTPKILVHGGGVKASKFAEKMGIPVKMLEGRRVTDADMLNIVVMVYAGLVNKQIVAMLQARQNQALGMTGADMDVIRAVKRPTHPVDYGFVGDIKRINVEKLANLLDGDIVPILSPITHDGAGNLLNTNADTIASEVAIALSKRYKVRLGFCFEKKGVLANMENEESVLNSLSEQEYKNQKEIGSIHSGMIPKLDNAYRAISKGVTLVKIMHHRDIHRWQPDGLTKQSDFGTNLYAS